MLIIIIIIIIIIDITTPRHSIHRKSRKLLRRSPNAPAFGIQVHAQLTFPGRGGWKQRPKNQTPKKETPFFSLCPASKGRGARALLSWLFPRQRAAVTSSSADRYIEGEPGGQQSQALPYPSPSYLPCLDRLTKEIAASR